ncbi:TonB-dependent receptor [Catenovulum adriaticum]|uniref:TonB-dependent receptor n=1 Tax=Catenovulum adriaticum TaxID=2984846 RepID=A0ABY7ALH2_9ALTE|nr:TonB-dependent receptor [Catenovulum sp. TS8]WAJ70402.1 TonB-dependent receptor [Catenovulum sp. TS8]
MKKLSVILLSTLTAPAFADVPEKEVIEIEGRKMNLIGEAISASQGIVGKQEIELRPMLRTGDVLEFVPGMVVTQHSGTGKANQYFLRGFNLDHGTDFSTSIDGMPINMRTHGHGQGYTDLNFIIPETIEKLSYKKGGYYADVGDFSGAGSAQMFTSSQVDNGEAEITLGENNFLRLLAMDSSELANGHILAAVEYNENEGPWSDIDEDLSKTNLLVKYAQPLADGQLSFSFMGYDNSWNSADQIPSRAVEQDLISELGSLDNSLGGESSRYSLNVDWQNKHWHASAYAIQYDMKLWSNFTYFLEDEDNGDQFEQVDKRNIFGGQLHFIEHSKIAGLDMSNKIGAEIRYDDIDEVGLYHTQQRNRLGVVRKDAVKELSTAVYWENRISWSDNLRSVFGARADYYDFEVKDLAGTNQNGVDLSANSGEQDDSLASFKGSLIYTLSDDWETYLSAGQGFHSNDARGTTIQVDPSDASAVSQVDPLVRSFGYEAGLRGFITEKLNTSVALWSLELDSELLFVGDAGNTEASRGSERKGLEITTYYYFSEQLSADFEYAYTDAEFSQNAPEGNHIPGAIEHVLQAGLNAKFDNGLFGSVRLRHFGERPLNEDASVYSGSSSIMNLRAGYAYDKWTFVADILNLTDSQDHDIDYLYESKLAGENTAVEDIHYHVFEPRQVRFSVSYQL